MRGLNERVLAGDAGLQASAEFWSPAIAEGTRGILFYDYGEVRRHNDTVFGFASASSIGAGLRWTMGNSWSANLDYAHVLSGLGYLPAGTSRDRVHFNLNLRY